MGMFHQHGKSHGKSFDRHSLRGMLPPMIYAFRTPDELVTHRSRDAVVHTRTTSVRLPFEGPARDGPTIVVLEAAGL